MPSRALCLGGTWSNVCEQDRPSKRACRGDWGDKKCGYVVVDFSKCLDGSDGRPRNLILDDDKFDKRLSEAVDVPE